MPSTSDPAQLDSRLFAETPEGILLELRPAGLAPRFLAFSIDWAIRLGILWIATIAMSVAGGLGWAFWLLLLFALEWGYPVFFELGAAGATPGKRVARIRVVMDDGLPVTPAASVTRNLLRIADFLPFAYGFGLASLLMRGDFKRLGDIAARTLVVHTSRPTVAAMTDEREVEPPPIALNLRQQAAIIAFAARSAQLTPERSAELAAMVTLPRDGSIGKRPADARRLRAIAGSLLGAS